MKNLSRLSQQVQISDHFAANPQLLASLFAVSDGAQLVLVLVKKSLGTVSCHSPSSYTAMQPSTMLSLSSSSQIHCCHDNRESNLKWTERVSACEEACLRQ